MPTAYSYIRFSTPEQKLGNSLARQLEATTGWAADNGFTLDDSMKDEGLSAYHGRHLAATAHLGNFLSRIKAGQIAKGSVLIVEHLDRLGRDDVEDALARFIDIKNHVDIVTMMDGQRYSKGDHWSKLMIAIVSMATANEESAKKAERTADNWKRVRGTTSALCPSWIRKTPAGFEIDREKANIVRYLGTDLLLKMGFDKAAQTLEAGKIPTLNGRTRQRSQGVWDQACVRAIFKDRKVLGEQSIGKYIDGKRHDTREVVINAYPAIMTEGEYFALWTAIQARKHGSPADARKTGLMTNLFGNLARCRECGSRMVVQRRGSTTHLYLTCSLGRASRDKCSSGRYHRLDAIEAEMLDICDTLMMDDKPANDPSASIKAEMEDAEATAIQLQKRYDTLFLRFADEAVDSPAAKSLAKLSDDIRAKQAATQSLRSKLAASFNAVPGKDRLKDAQAAWGTLGNLSGEARIKARRTIAGAMPHLIKTITFGADGEFDITWADGFTRAWDQVDRNIAAMEA